jgi:hypothetical protein
MGDGHARSLSAVGGMVHTVEDGDVVEVERTDALEAGYVYTVLGVVGTAPMESVGTALRAEVMLCGAGIELIEIEGVFTLLNGNSIEFCGDNDSATHAAVRAIAASCGTETVAEPDREADGAAVAGRFGLGDIREHGNTLLGQT